MRFTPRTALGLGLMPLLAKQEEIALVGWCPANKTSILGVTHAAGRGDLNDRNTVNSEAAAEEKRA